MRWVGEHPAVSARKLEGTGESDLPSNREERNSESKHLCLESYGKGRDYSWVREPGDLAAKGLTQFHPPQRGPERLHPGGR